MSSDLVIEASQKHTATIVFLHGLGGSGSEWEITTRSLRSSLGHVKWIFPQAPTRSVTVNNGRPTPAWFDVAGFGAVKYEEDVPGFKQSIAQITKIIQGEIDNGIPCHRIILGGFSQGCTMTYLAGLTFEQKLGGLVLLSGRLPLQEQFKSGEWKASQYAASLPIFWAHGADDAVVSLNAQGMESRRILESYLGIKELAGEASPDTPGIWARIYKGMGHSVCEQELNDVGQWLATVIPGV